MRSIRSPYFGFSLSAAVLAVTLHTQSSERGGDSGYTGSRICASCHAEIAKSYAQTPMALSSGKMDGSAFQESLAKGKFVHAQSGVTYRIFKEKTQTLFEYLREGKQSPRDDLRGKGRLDYFIGSGTAGRSYVSVLGGHLFQAPVSYYAQTGKWDISPGFQEYDHVHLSRPIEARCLGCHASQLQPIQGTQNRFAETPFLEAGVSCARCHGQGAGHVSRKQNGDSMGLPDIVNPAKLDPARRDSVCSNCHLSGEARIVKAGRSTFKPGDLLSDYVLSFVWSDRQTNNLTVTSHVEKLSQSVCQQSSGTQLWCGSCHSPHVVIPASERARHYRQKCLACHNEGSCTDKKEARVQAADNCITCHMPKSPTVDVGHTVFTNHSIPRRPPELAEQNSRLAGTSLRAFGTAAASSRDLGLAYAEVATGQKNAMFAQRSFELLKGVEGMLSGDAPALLQLAFLYDGKQDRERAMQLYQKALGADPSQVVALLNLGALLAQQHQFREAISLWQEALKQNPGLETASIYLALASLRTGKALLAREELLKGSEFNPDSKMIRKLLADLGGESPQGKVRK
jgi:Tfp pilus assembly protein PilF